MNFANPLEFLKAFPLNDTKELIKTLKKDLSEVTKDPQYNGEADILLCVIKSLEHELAHTENVETLTTEKQARVLADLCLLMQYMQAGQEFEGEFDEDEDETEEDEE